MRPRFIICAPDKQAFDGSREKYPVGLLDRFKQTLVRRSIWLAFLTSGADQALDASLVNMLWLNQPAVVAPNQILKP
jgi:hypothetical protein